jgi:hypothetical protein
MALLCEVEWLGPSIFSTFYNKFILTVNFLQPTTMKLSLFPLTRTHIRMRETGNDARSRNHYCRRKAIYVKYFEGLTAFLP